MAGVCCDAERKEHERVRGPGLLLCVYSTEEEENEEEKWGFGGPTEGWEKGALALGIAARYE